MIMEKENNPDIWTGTKEDAPWYTFIPGNPALGNPCIAQS